MEGAAPKLDDYNAMRELFAQLHEKYGRIDILVNNAGVSARESLYTYDPTDFDWVMDLNVNSVFYACRAVAPIMKAQGGGVILNTSSMVSLYGQAAGVAYPTSKWAINGLTKSLARELGPDGIRVNAVAPGVTRTDMVAALMGNRLQLPIQHAFARCHAFARIPLHGQVGGIACCIGTCDCEASAAQRHKH